MNFYAHRVEIRIEGFRIDKLLNKALAHGMDIRSFKMLSDLEACCWISPDELKKLKKLAGALYKITEVQHRGVVYRTEKFIKAPIRVLGAILLLALVISQSFFVKTIEVSGYKGIPETELLKCLSEDGIKEGAFMPNIDWAAAETKLYDVFPQITWVRLVYDGRKVFLDIAETGVAAKDQGEEEAGGQTTDAGVKPRMYTNIVATESGYIQSVSSYRGLAIAEEGAYVQKGQVLILGRVPIQATVFKEGWPEEYFVKAQGEIWATVPYRLTFNQTKYVSSPVGSKTTVLNKQKKTEKEAKAKVNQQIRSWCRENLPENAQILNKDLNFCYKENIIEVGVTLEVRRQIGEEQETLIGQENSDGSGN